MKHITDAILLETIRSMPREFDSHDLLQALATQYPHEYVRELAEKLHTNDPILQAHSDIASQLNRDAFTSVVKKSAMAKSRNIRGKVTKNQLWKQRE